METRIQGFSVIGGLKWQVWDGVVADLWDVACRDSAGGHYVSPDPRLFVVLEIEGDGALEVTDEASGTSYRHDRPFSMSYVPAGMAIRGSADGLRRLKHLDLHFDETALTRRFGGALDRVRLEEPRLQFVDAPIAAIATLIAAECAEEAARHPLYGEGLLNALFAALFQIGQTGPLRRRAPLSRRQLRVVTDYIEAHCLETVRLSELAALVDLSETAFSHAFKAATGVPPHRWQMQARVERVKNVLLSTDMPLTEVAAFAGFFDQAHFTRVFKGIVGMAPGAWLKHQRGCAE